MLLSCRLKQITRGMISLDLVSLYIVFCFITDSTEGKLMKDTTSSRPNIETKLDFLLSLDILNIESWIFDHEFQDFPI